MNKPTSTTSSSATIIVIIHENIDANKIGIPITDWSENFHILDTSSAKIKRLHFVPLILVVTFLMITS